MNTTQAKVNQLIENIDQSVIGQYQVAKSIVIGLITGGHILLEGLPGTAKTRSVKVLADSMKASFGRIQFTPDLLPSDVTGTTIYQEVNGKPNLTFQKGPIFNNILLADEINRAPAKVQSALLEAMAEGTITVGETTYQLPSPFIVLATQNPIEQEGTYPLPEAQMDRFMLKVVVHYPDEIAEKKIIQLIRSEESNHELNLTNKDQILIEPNTILEARKEISQIKMPDISEDYIIALVMATRNPERYKDTNLSKWIEVGSSPRASIAIDRCARAQAWLAGRDHVIPDDIRAILHPVLTHRLHLSYSALADGISSDDIVDLLLDTVMIG